MSTYVSRIIQVKKDDKWQTLEWFAKNKAYVNEKKDLYKFDEYYDNAIAFRQVLADSDLAERGLPSDIELEPEVKEQLNKRMDWEEKTVVSKVVPGYNKYSYSATYFTLAELQMLYASLRDKWFKKHKEAVLNEEFVKKIDCIYKELIEKTPVEPLTKEDLDEEYNELAYLEEEEFYDFMSVYNESCIVSHLVGEIYGWVNESNVRIIVYYS